MRFTNPATVELESSSMTRFKLLSSSTIEIDFSSTYASFQLESSWMKTFKFSSTTLDFSWVLYKARIEPNGKIQTVITTIYFSWVPPFNSNRVEWKDSNSHLLHLTFHRCVRLTRFKLSFNDTSIQLDSSWMAFHLIFHVASIQLDSSWMARASVQFDSFHLTLHGAFIQLDSSWIARASVHFIWLFMLRSFNSIRVEWQERPFSLIHFIWLCMVRSFNSIRVEWHFIWLFHVLYIQLDSSWITRASVHFIWLFMLRPFNSIRVE